MADANTELTGQIKKALKKRIESNKKIQAALRAIRRGSKSYDDAFQYAEEIGAELAAAIKDIFAADSLYRKALGASMLQNLAEDVLGEAYEEAAAAAESVQTAINKSAGIGLKAVKSSEKNARLEEIVKYTSWQKKYSEISTSLLEKAKSLPQDAVSDTLTANAEFQSAAGMQPTIRRTASAGCCAECAARAGTYTYPGVNKIVFYKHTNCHCTVEYYPGNGMKQDSHTKQWTRADEADKIQSRIKNAENTAKRESVSKALGIANSSKVTIPPREINTNELIFDTEHVKSRNHNATREDAINWIKNAVFSVEVWNGQYRRYISNDGAAYVSLKDNAIKTAFGKEEFTKSFLDALKEAKS